MTAWNPPTLDTGPRAVPPPPPAGSLVEAPTLPAVRRGRALLLATGGTVGAVVYLSWLLRPEHIGHPFLYVLLVAAELFNVVQALGFWWTCIRRTPRRRAPRLPTDVAVDVLVPVYDEPVEVVEPTVRAATRLRGAKVRVALLDDGSSPAMEALARRHGAAYVRRPVHSGAKAGNLNHAIARTSAPFIVVFDCDHVPAPEFLEQTLGYFADPQVAFVQTPQHYANADRGGVAAAAWSQQALFFGPIARGKDAGDAMFCCGTNVVFRREALQGVGGFPEGSLTEDFELSVALHEHGWRSVYVPEVLASGLGPEDMASYVGQQLRWARGCLSAAPRVLRAGLRPSTKAQYLLSSLYFLSGWTVLLYMALPVVRLWTGAQPVAATSADQFLLYFGPYFGLALVTLATVSTGRYGYDAYSLAFATFWVHVAATLATLTGRSARFVVTPKQGATGRQPRAVWPTLLAIAVLVGTGVWGLVQSRSPATLNNVAFAAMHVTVLAGGASHALRAPRRAEAEAATDARLVA